MDIIKYKVFLNTVDRGCFNKVCEDLGYTQSGISKMMSSMENEIGFPLIVRNNKGISLTSEGERVLPLIRQLVKDNEALEEEFSFIRGIESGMVRIGSFPTTAFAWMSQILRSFHAEHPHIQVEVVEENSLKLLEQWLNQGIIDIGLFSYQPHHNFNWISIKKDPYVALLPKSHPLEKKAMIPIKDLFKEKMILFKSHEGLDQDVVGLMAHVDIKVTPSYTTNSDFTVIRMVEQNQFVTILPKLIADYAVDLFEVVYRPIDVDVSREIGMAVKYIDRVSPAIKKFIEHAKNAML